MDKQSRKSEEGKWEGFWGGCGYMPTTIPLMGKETGSPSPPSWMQDLRSFTTAELCNCSHHSFAIKIVMKFRMTLKIKRAI